METAHKLHTILLDKTGTITQVKPALTDVIVDPALQGSQDEFLRLVASAERGSEHPLGEAIVQGALQRGLRLSRPIRFSVAIAAFDSGLISSATATRPANCPSPATYMAVLPAADNSAARASREPVAMPWSCISLALPSNSLRPSTRAAIPLPVTESNSVASD